LRHFSLDFPSENGLVVAVGKRFISRIGASAVERRLCSVLKKDPPRA
jgi:hypothetical protein